MQYKFKKILQNTTGYLGVKGYKVLISMISLTSGNPTMRALITVSSYTEDRVNRRSIGKVSKAI